MYSRSPNRPPRPAKLPENYSGNAFRKAPPPETVDRPCPPDPPPMALLPKPPHPDRPIDKNEHPLFGAIIEQFKINIDAKTIDQPLACPLWLVKRL